MTSIVNTVIVTVDMMSR